MDSLSRPFHSTKLSNAKTPYDAVFTPHHRNFTGPSPIDYREIFAASQSSSIPVLDLSTLRESSDSLSLDFKVSNPDYSKIFGGFVSYEELFGSDKARAPSSTTPASQDSDNPSHQSRDELKRFNMSYNKISKKSKDGLDGAKHVTQSPAVTGYTRFIDETVMEAEKWNPSAVNVSVDFPKKQSSGNAVKKESKHVESIFEDKKSKIFDVDFRNDQKRSINPDSCKADLGDEIDVNSSASASSAALKKAIEKAQESIRIAKESVGRKKKGLQSFSSKKIKNSLKVEGGMEDVTTAGEEKKYGGTVGFPSFMESEKLFVAKKFIDEIHEKISESVKDSKFVDHTVVYNATQVTSESESKLLDPVGKDDYATLCSEAVDTETSKIQISDCVHEYQTDNMIIDEHEDIIKVIKPTVEIFERQSVVKELELEENNDEVRLSNAHELAEELNNLNASQKWKDEKEASQDFNQNDNELLENEKQEHVLEHEDSENAEREKHEEIEEASERVKSEDESKHDQNSEIHKDEETSETFDGFCERDAKDSVQTCDNMLEESEVNDGDREIKQEDNPTVETKVESLEESRDQEFDEKLSDDNVMEENDDIDCVDDASNIVEMNDINMETTQEVDDVTEVSCEFQAEEADFCEKTSTDQTASDDNEDEHEVKSEENNIIDNLADLGLDDDVRSESSSGSTHGVKIIGEEHEVKSEENNIIDNLADLGLDDDDVRSESSSGSTHGVKIIGEESDIQPPHNEIPDTESTNEIKDSQEPESRQKQDEVEEPGPSKVSGKDRFRRIDEEAAAKEREWERNRLAVDRAIREARERAFAEARERSERERAAVEKATEEVRQRMMAEAHEKVSRASVMNKPSSERARERAERAAVERATSEARQRALEKAISQKTVSDLNRSESALRTKAKLEKHNRIMERAAKALAEKEKRDRLAQKEQAERNRLAENLDADIKRWSNGKEGNLRALLSTLQYILGPESGWQPVSLTEIITTSAVKKAYRKATLCVHPDKLQQRGATIQHKYICEKVFDLLKAAWSRFNSAER
ncbi:hypothetical protein L1987_80351 [Smallanthus sonchifolius]|uniref:Uncharacterized protein n=1 Tax=Smallanthus sonchifolius TaxID=185202 RepID=A0ACB8YML4_9ASTR|nr:hypothetical protein L1987_80351 [Smallanthus sonchifolius]